MMTDASQLGLAICPGALFVRSDATRRVDGPTGGCGVSDVSLSTVPVEPNRNDHRDSVHRAREPSPRRDAIAARCARALLRQIKQGHYTVRYSRSTPSALMQTRRTMPPDEPSRAIARLIASATNALHSASDMPGLNSWSTWP